MDLSERQPLIVALLGVGLAATLASVVRPTAVPSREVPDQHQTSHDSVDTSVDDVPVLTPSQSMAQMEIKDGFEISLAASEPMIEDPVAATFDANGRLWVCEMRSYMPDELGTDELVPTSRIVVLDDDDGDGVMDRSAVFLDGLVMPRAIAACRDGVLIIEPPNLLFCRDTDGDDVCDEKRVLLDGFGGHENPEHAGNGLMYGLDNWYHLSQHHLEVRFDGETLETRPTPGHGQWGITQDAFGRLYYVPNSDTLRGDLVPKHYAKRNPHQSRFEGLNIRVGQDLRTWPAHATGVNRGYRDGVLRDDGRLANVTAACGPSIYLDDVFPDEMHGDAFVCEPSGNLIKLVSVEERDGIPVGQNAYIGSEFLVCTDERFRPVNSLVAPDGALVLVDMYRGLIQHRIYLTDYLKEYLLARGMEAPIGLGRLYRIAPVGMERQVRPALSGATNEELVGLLEHPSQWWRINAQRLLVERRAVDAASALREMAGHPREEVRLHALWTLDGIGAINGADVTAGLRDPHPQVRRNALRISERLVGDDAMTGGMAALADDPDRFVRVQLALSTGAWVEQDETWSLDMLATLGRSDDAMMRSAVLSSAAGQEVALIRELVDSEGFGGTASSDRALLALLADAALRDQQQRAAIVDLAASLTSDRSHLASALVARVESAVNVAGDTPRVLTFDSEPAGWHILLATSSRALDSRADSLERFLDWPGKPAIDPATYAPPLRGAAKEQFDLGRRLYAACHGCHGPAGEGTQDQVPSLVGSSRVLGSPRTLTRILMHGLEGPIESGGQTYDGRMPPAPLGDDEQFAAVMTYIRRAWGNVADPVDAKVVEGVRAISGERYEPWTADELADVESREAGG